MAVGEVLDPTSTEAVERTAGRQAFVDSRVQSVGQPPFLAGIRGHPVDGVAAGGTIAVILEHDSRHEPRPDIRQPKVGY